jgi:hypothetical protein
MGTDKELLEKAKKEAIDVLAVLRVEITLNKIGIVINECQLALFDVARQSPLYTSIKIRNTTVELNRQSNKEDGVEKFVNALFAYVDKGDKNKNDNGLLLSAMPEVPPAIVKSKRVDVLAAGAYDNPLPVLAEIRFYNRQKLISDEDTQAAFVKLLGGNETAAKTLLTGSEEERKTVIEKWLPKG